MVLGILQQSSVNPEHFKNVDIRNKHIAKTHFMEKGNFSDKIQRAFYNSESMKLSTVEDILEYANSNIYEYLNYLNEIKS